MNRWKYARPALPLLPALLALLVLLPGCRKLDPDEYSSLDPETRIQRQYVKLFAWNLLSEYYLWTDEIAADLDAWKDWEEPIQKVADIRYKNAKGEDIDRWTMLTDDYASIQGAVSGHTRTLGLDFRLYYVDQARTRIGAVVTYTAASSPAEAAGIVRGDIILSVDGTVMTRDNYRDLVLDGILGGETVTLGLSDGRTFTVTPVDMYEEPVHTSRILERPDGRKVGYLHYTAFTLESVDALVDAFREFTLAGVDDMVLDLRYNSGGYVITEQVLASMLAPLKEVEAKSVFSRNIYNAILTEELGDDATLFSTGFIFRRDGALQVVSTKGANPDLPRLYVLVTEESASASESLICGLRPYMDVILVGEQTSGKYCAGLLLPATDWYDEIKDALEEGEYEYALPYVDNWGLYVMYARYADCNGVTLSMPDGIAPDFEVEDDPLDGHALGDPEETMLSAALSLMEGRTRRPDSRPGARLMPLEEGAHPRSTGLLVAQSR